MMTPSESGGVRLRGEGLGWKRFRNRIECVKKVVGLLPQRPLQSGQSSPEQHNQEPGGQGTHGQGQPRRPPPGRAAGQSTHVQARVTSSS